MMITACSSTGNKQTVKETVVETKKVEAPVFNQDSALYFVEKQMSFGNRIPNTKAHLETV